MIRSPQNKLIQSVKRWQQSARNRNEDHLYILEHPKAIRERIQGDDSTSLRHLLISETVTDPSFTQHKKATLIQELVFKGISDVSTNQGILAVFDQPNWGLDQCLSTAATIALLSGVQDPSNIGAIVRSALAFGVDALFLDTQCADLYHPRSVRASVGLVDQLPCFPLDSNTIAALKDTDFSFYSLDSHASLSLSTVLSKKDRSQKLGLLLGSEGQGVDPSLVSDFEAQSLCIPMAGHVESLNVAVTAGICFYHLHRD